jgi:hypothetical protein
VRCQVSADRAIDVPVFAGILKHPTVEALRRLLKNPDVVRTYTLAALRKAAWPILRRFPRDWLRECMPEADVRPTRRKALEFLLG